jgi:hypothetical protein
MAVELLFGRRSPGKIGSITLDATLSERQVFRNEVTSFPIESGSNISDHVFRNPEEIEMTGFITNTPIKFLSGIRSSGEDLILDAYLTLLSIAGYQYPEQAYNFNILTDIVDTTNKNVLQLVDILSSMRIYTNMALVNLDIPRDAKSGDSMRFNVLFRKVNIVELVSVPSTPKNISSTVPRANKQEPSTASAGKAGTRESILFKGGKSVSGSAAKLKSIFGK